MREQRSWHVRELAITRVLDERGQVDDSLADPDAPGEDQRWAAEGSKWSPVNLAARVREQRPPTVERMLRRVVRRGSCGSGSDDLSNLATVCTTHHTQLAPQAQTLLLGDPNNPAGLSLVHGDDLPHRAQLASHQARAGPDAA